MEEPKVSVIVPVYKAEDYLARCVDSLLAQTFTDFEIILVDDGSTDRSGEICDEYAGKDKRVKVIHQRNGGVTAARSAGVNAAGGEWITFVDADDFLPDTALSALYTATEDGKYHIVRGAFNSLGTSEELPAMGYRHDCVRWEYGSPCAQLVHRSLFSKDTFQIPRKLVYGEDVIMNVRLAFFNAKPVKIISDVVYCYELSDVSVSNAFSCGMDYVELFHAHLKESIPNDEQAEYAQDMGYTLIAFLGNVCRTHLGDLLKPQPLIREIKKVMRHQRLPLRSRILLSENPILLRLAYWVARLRHR